MADLFGYNPKSEGLEASMLFIYTTDLYNKNRFPHIRKAVSIYSMETRILLCIHLESPCN